MTATAVRGVTLHQLTLVTDLRGRLAAGEFDRQIPFTPRRYFTVFDVPGKEVRGEHAHRRCQQFLICIRGSVHVVVDDGTTAAEIELNDPGRGVFVPPLVWAIQFEYSADAVLLVFASDPYDADDYIRDYDEFLALVALTDTRRGRRPGRSARDEVRRAMRAFCSASHRYCPTMPRPSAVSPPNEVMASISGV